MARTPRKTPAPTTAPAAAAGLDQGEAKIPAQTGDTKAEHTGPALPSTGTEGAPAAGETLPAATDPAPLPLPAFTVVVTGPRGGRRRIGRAFGPEPVSISAEVLTDDEILALQADPHLTVEIVDAPY